MHVKRSETLTYDARYFVSVDGPRQLARSPPCGITDLTRQLNKITTKEHGNVVPVLNNSVN
jgi:hypothetical protein